MIFKSFLVVDMWAWALLPIFLTIWGTVGIWIVYIIAVYNGSVSVGESFPFISTCGSYPPQSCIFAQILNVGAMLVIWIIVIRFQQIRDYGCHSHVNSVGLAMGFLCALGTSLVGNFQQSNQLETHLVGAFLAFIIGVVYFWIQTYLTYRVQPRHGGCWIGPLRFILTLCATALIIIMIVFYTKQMKSASAICEWILAMVLFVLFGLFCVDFWFLEGHFFHVRKRRVVIPNEIQLSTVTLSL
ncbi:modulator of macroautophagy TMEM150B isoform X2 [Hyla sarda]|uniref:modulator of macroautophagy TMEM150B isoform X2 n=1 Tax=Hyla sarda TaxID=327740 RepID=UPI0024C253B9|nr:modulator of macroautophagy TMEM150B isoform X2 [Hyla sarda]